MSVSTVVFDFGNVLGFFSDLRAAEQLAVYADAAPEAIQAYLFGGQLEEEFESGRVSAEMFRGLVRERFRMRCDDAQFDAAFGDMFTPNPDVCPLPALLKPHCRLLLLSNTNELHARMFRRQFASVLSVFDATVLSFEVGVRKPDPRIYEHCRRLAGRPASECLFIDDLPTNVEGATACGWRGVVYRRGDDLRRELAAIGAPLDVSVSRDTQRSASLRVPR
jgi:putative hydrolase of the HAD superfamily